MKQSHTRLVVAIVAALAAGQALAWASANRAGGSTSHSAGSTSHTNAYGGSSTHEAGQGTEHTNTYGGSTAHSEYGGTEHTNAAGGSTAGPVRRVNCRISVRANRWRRWKCVAWKWLRRVRRKAATLMCEWIRT